MKKGEIIGLRVNIENTKYMIMTRNIKTLGDITRRQPNKRDKRF